MTVYLKLARILLVIKGPGPDTSRRVGEGHCAFDLDLLVDLGGTKAAHDKLRNNNSELTRTTGKVKDDRWYVDCFRCLD